MEDIQKLMEMPVNELLQELRARETKTGKTAMAVPAEPSESLREFDDATIVGVLKEKQRVIYGIDDRIDVCYLPDGPDKDDVDSVVALFRASKVIDNGDGTSTLQTSNFGESKNLCPGERFRNQPTGAFCSGFLVAPDIIATAGHCVNAGNVTIVRFVFGFRMRDSNTAETIIDNTEIYRGVELIGREEAGHGADWALVRIDRPVTNHRIARIRRNGKVSDTQKLHVIGHPAGLPTKFAGGASIRDNQKGAFFTANLDTYGGNSGSPVFNSETHEVEGILVRGETDFVSQGTCNVSLVCPSSGCRGEDCTRTTEFQHLVPEPSSLQEQPIPR
ncbi:MAG TPA: serine protease [Methanosarcina thermophila]|mgnify:FL=1|nr:serine protease [Methanosarcina thermophila]HPZ20880.1 serine protease [Methanosarcina thermophila]HQD95103.1 serine protease [Methanosarcina thermophila]